MQYTIFKNGHLFAVRNTFEAAIKRFESLVENNPKHDYYELRDDYHILKTN